GFDGSDPSKRAAKVAAEMASRSGAGITLAEVVPQLYIPGDSAGMLTADLMQRDHHVAEQQLASVADELRASGASDVRTEVLEGSPSSEMARVADGDPEVDMVVVGRSGKGAVKRALLGSVATRLAQTCTKPVLIV
ncbi:MAG TPA: universal stress protein, partial [Myxococcales bacterium]|nr:universal stress protein [Myxococcales bacterium]